ncbi:hypothetical protein PP487_gp32 [Gordonia phage Herod]|uniref:Uncharacterized protein n=5 Tax=Nymphadoravirus TaxID=2169636 RepID=A0A142KAQ8_9CAUD|nr:hypothetical protein SEA_NYMPHADORA_32 [Gordonia phage Nymphadora]YP_010652897.1 hypothetical protein PP487_gp32 [Gordonia phage Herod]AOE43900.1 hypothetical protein SEA_BATSTARR_32 [Gordonia phage BatStarr]QDP43313.1 hypothetical protein SEA_EVIARTO_32 [Gordonia phage Eviarto]QDP43395.1 hypothetical protein SEA_TIMTAM_32 [Gordonia phage TimTam]AMS03191.1 hypothetical protein SEA_NYMPHADORA_32 [Gordonia phage Nymphadora]QOP67335.1 hypothetical protein SEA_HEROD_32 [Gordonia phage Herod]
MILPVLVLGDGRYLTLAGEVAEARRQFTSEEAELYRSLSHDWDPELEAAPGDAVRLTDENHAHWEESARRSGHTLAELLASDPGTR